MIHQDYSALSFVIQRSEIQFLLDLIESKTEILKNFKTSADGRSLLNYSAIQNEWTLLDVHDVTILLNDLIQDFEMTASERRSTGTIKGIANLVPLFIKLIRRRLHSPQILQIGEQSAETDSRQTTSLFVSNERIREENEILNADSAPQLETQMSRSHLLNNIRHPFTKEKETSTRTEGDLSNHKLSEPQETFEVQVKFEPADDLEGAMTFNNSELPANSKQALPIDSNECNRNIHLSESTTVSFQDSDVDVDAYFSDVLFHGNETDFVLLHNIKDALKWSPLEKLKHRYVRQKLIQWAENKRIEFRAVHKVQRNGKTKTFHDVLLKCRLEPERAQ